MFVVEGSQPSHQRTALAAVLACGPDAALSHPSAAVHWRLLKYPPSLPQLTSRGTSGARGPRGVELHHARTLEVTTHEGISITTLPRTLNDIAPTLRPHVLKAAVRQAEIQHRLDLTNTTAVGALRRFLTDYVSINGVTNDFEADFLELCVRHDIPRPEAQYEIPPYRADFAWPAYRLIVETDGRATHDGFVSFREDRVRRRFLQSQGWEVLQFTYEEVTRQPDLVAREVRAALRGADR